MSAPGLFFNVAAEKPVVSCTANPLDLRPALDAIMEAIKTHPRNRPLVVLMGERHFTPSHTMLQQGLLQRLLAGSSAHSLNTIGFGYEAPHNLPKWVTTLPSPAIANLMSFCKNKKITVNFNDVCVGFSEKELKQRDPATRAIVKQFAPEHLGSEISATESLGLALRNRMIVDRVMNQIRETKAKVYVQHCGRNHIFGTYINDDYKDSLTAYFIEASVDVLPVFLTNGSLFFNKELSEMQALMKRTIVIEGMSWKNSLNSLRAEKALIEEISTNSGGEIKIFPDGIVSKVLQLARG